MNDARDKIEESHGLWELAIVRLATMVEVHAAPQDLMRALCEERAAFATWKKASDRWTNSQEWAP